MRTQRCAIRGCANLERLCVGRACSSTRIDSHIGSSHLHWLVLTRIGSQYTRSCSDWPASHSYWLVSHSYCARMAHIGSYRTSIALVRSYWLVCVSHSFRTRIGSHWHTRIGSHLRSHWLVLVRIGSYRLASVVLPCMGLSRSYRLVSVVSYTLISVVSVVLARILHTRIGSHLPVPHSYWLVLTRIGSLWRASHSC